MRVSFAVLAFALVIGVPARLAADAAADSGSESLLKTANQLVKKDRYDEAIALYSKLLALEPANVEALTRRAQAYATTARPELALKDLDALLAADPTNRSALLTRARVHDAAGHVAEAIADVTASIAVKKDMAAFELRAALYEKTGQVDHAVADYSEVLRMQPNRADLYMIRGRLYKMMNERIKAGQDFGTAIRLNPTYTVAVNRIISGAVPTKVAVAKPTLPVVPGAGPAVPAVVAKQDARKLVVRKEKKEKPAEQQTAQKQPEPEKKKEAKPEKVEVAKVEKKKDEQKQARKPPKRILPAEPSDLAALPPLPPETKEAEPEPVPAAPQRAPVQAAASPTLAEANQKVAAAKRQIEARQYAEAIAALNPVVAEHPKLAEAVLTRCIAQFHAGDMKAAIADCTKALEVRQANADAHFYRGRAYHAEKDYIRADEDYYVAAGLKGYFPEAHFYRGQVNLAMDNLVQALYQFSEAWRQKGTFTEALLARAELKKTLGDTTGYNEDIALSAKPQAR